MSNCRNGLFKSHPKSMFVRYIDIVKNPENLEDELIVWEKYAFTLNVNGRGHCTEVKEKIPVVVLQVVQVGDRVWAEVLKKEDYNNETLF